uniref:Uncharacterized protein n=1 Tax=Romanomermis culicivorax TaxID=13658 RepID=A0A915KBU5_ROMCU
MPHGPRKECCNIEKPSNSQIFCSPCNGLFELPFWGKSLQFAKHMSSTETNGFRVCMENWPLPLILPGQTGYKDIFLPWKPRLEKIEHHGDENSDDRLLCLNKN